MKEYRSPKEKLPQEGEAVMVCLVTGGVYGMRYEDGKFTCATSLGEKLFFEHRKVLKWRYPEESD